MAEKTKLNCLSLEKKREILALVDKKTMSKTDICKQFDIPKSTMSTFIKNRDKINSQSESCQPSRIFLLYFFVNGAFLVKTNYGNLEHYSNPRRIRDTRVSL